MLMEMMLTENVKRQVLVVGLRCDLAGRERAIDYQDGERTAEAFSAPYIECSAKADINVEAVFDLVLTQIFKYEKKSRDKKRVGKSILSEAGFERAQAEDKSCCLLF